MFLRSFFQQPFQQLNTSELSDMSDEPSGPVRPRPNPQGNLFKEPDLRQFIAQKLRSQQINADKGKSVYEPAVLPPNILDISSIMHPNSSFFSNDSA